MVYAIQIEVTFRNAQRRNAAASLIPQRVSELPTFGSLEMSNGKVANSLVFIVRFLDKASQDNFWVELDSLMGTGLNGPIAGSRAYRHDCPHDAARPTPCVISELRTF